MEQFLLSLIIGVFVGGTAGYLGTLMLSKRMALVVDPLGHLALPGVALALMFGFDVSLGAFFFIILGMVLIWAFELKTKLPTEALTAIIFTLGVAITFLFFNLEHEELERAFIGDITKINLSDTILAIIFCLILIFLTKKFYSKITLISVSEELAKSEGIDVKNYNLLFLILVASIVSLGVKLVGGLLTAALVSIPAAASRNLSKNLFQYILFGTIFGILSSFLGIFAFKITNFPAGPLIILFNFFLFLISLIFKKG